MLRIALAVIFCCAHNYLSGDALVIDGGAYLWKPPAMPRDAILSISRGVEQKSRSMEAKL